MPGRDGPSQLVLAAVWIITQGTTTDASFQSPKQKRRRPKRNQGGAGIQQLPGPQAHPSGFLTEIAAMGRWSGAQSDWPNTQIHPAQRDSTTGADTDTTRELAEPA